MKYDFLCKINSLIENYCLVNKLYPREITKEEDYSVLFLHPIMHINNTDNEYFIAIERVSDNNVSYDILKYLGDVEIIYNPSLKVNVIDNFDKLKEDILECVQLFLSDNDNNDNIDNSENN